MAAAIVQQCRCRPHVHPGGRVYPVYPGALAVQLQAAGASSRKKLSTSTGLGLARALHVSKRHVSVAYKTADQHQENVRSVRARLQYVREQKEGVLADWQQSKEVLPADHPELDAFQRQLATLAHTEHTLVRLEAGDVTVQLGINNNWTARKAQRVPLDSLSMVDIDQVLHQSGYPHVVLEGWWVTDEETDPTMLKRQDMTRNQELVPMTPGKHLWVKAKSPGGNWLLDSLRGLACTVASAAVTVLCDEAHDWDILDGAIPDCSSIITLQQDMRST